jgi:putative sigma-54 modulation protein
MELLLRHKRVNIGQSLREYIAGHIDTVLGRFADRIRRVTIYLVDVNGPRGGIDKRCNIAVQLVEGGTIRAGNVNTHLVAAIYYAADRAARAVRRESQRRRKLARQSRKWNPEADEAFRVS